MTSGATSNQDPGDPGQARVPYIARPLVMVRFSLDRSAWRVGPGWSVLLGAVAGGWRPDGAASLVTLVAAWLLADVAWGQLARLAIADREAAATGTPARIPLPYWSDGAPAARLARQLRSGSDVEPTGLSGDLTRLLGFLAGLGLLVILSVMLGIRVAGLTAVVIVCCACAGLPRGRGLRPGLLGAILASALPWSLGLVVFSGSPSSTAVAWHLAVGLAFSLVLWGETDGAGERKGSVRFILGCLLASVALISLRRPVGVAAMLLLLAPVASQMLRRDSDAAYHGVHVTNTPWTLVALAVAAVSMR